MSDQVEVVGSRHGAVVIITDLARQEFIVQRKDESYRFPQLARRLSFFGGGLEPGESAQRTLCREIEEEIKSPESAQTVVASLTEWETFTLQGRSCDISYDYKLHVFVSSLPPELFEAIAQDLVSRGGVTEGTAERILREDLVKLSQDPEAFIWGIERVVATFLQKNDSKLF